MIGNNEILNYLLIKEDFLPEPTDLGDGKITIGSGLTDSKWLDLYRKRGNKWSKEDNRKAVLEEIQKRRLWAEQNVPHWNSLPEPSQDALLSYRYNYNFTPKNSPKLFKALEDKNYLEAARQIDATSKNPDFKKGLLNRRKEEQQWFLSGFPELSKSNDFAIPYKYPVPEYPTAAEAYRKSMAPITDNYSQGGQLQNHKQWKDLSYSEKNDIIKVAVRNGITTLPEIRQKYNEFADGGNLYAGGGYVYDMLPQLFASDGVQVRVTSGYRPNSKVQGSGKPSRHSMHEAADIVGDFSAIRRVLDNPESNTAKWMRANGYGYLDETSKTGTKKFWHDQKGDHSHYHIGKDSGISKKFATSTDSTSNTTPIVSTGNYLDIAKAHIRNNEGWSPMPVADGPKNTGWRSVGYGFNDSGFRAKYPQGISKAYENGITKAQAEQELDYILGNMDSHLRRVYGSKWNSFNDNQKAAIIDTYYQRPASVVGRNSAFYNAVMRGDNNAVNYLGVAGYNTRNNDRRKLFSSTVTQMPEAAQTVQQPLFYQPWNPQAANLYTPYSPLTPYPAPIFSPEEQEEYFAKQIAQAQKQQEAEQREKQRQEKADRINRFSLLMNLTDPYSSDSSSSSSTPFADAVSMLTQRSPISYFSNGGSIFIKPENRGKFTRLKERTGHSASWFKENGTPAQKKMAIFALNSKHWKHGLGGNLFDGGGDTNENITPWKALNNIDYKAIPDTTFTREKTGTGSIEYFNSMYPEGITYPNGYHREHPLPGKDVILYNPNDNDEQDIRLDALHIMPKDATYDTLNTLYREAAKDGDVAYNAKRRYEEDLNKYGKENIDSYTQYFNNEADGLLRNMLIEGTPEYIESKRYYPNKRELREWNRHLLPYIDNIQKYLETGERPANILPEVTVYGKKKKKALGGNLFKDGGDTKANIPVTYFTQSEAMPLLADNPNRTAVLDEVTVRPYKKLPMQSELFQGITNQSANEKADEFANRTSLTPERFLGLMGANVPLAAGALGATVAAPALFDSTIVPLSDYITSSSIAGVPTTTWLNAGMEAGFAGHGLNHAVNEDINGWGDAAMTALEVAPLGKLARPMWNAGRNSLGLLKDDAKAFYNNLTMDLNSVPGRFYHGSPSRTIEEFIPGDSGGIYFTPTKKAARGYTGSLGTGRVYEANLNLGNSPVVVNARGKAWNAIPEEAVAKAFGIPKEEIYEQIGHYNAGAEPWYSDFLKPFGYSPNTRSYAVDQIVTLGKDLGKSSLTIKGARDSGKGLFGWRQLPYDQTIVYSPEQISLLEKSYPIKSAPQITAENAASMTPKQWTAAQDAAIARGDMAEAQRLRDLHFMTKAPNTFASINRKPLQLYHGTNSNFNAFDLSRYGSTDGGTFGRGVYTTPIQEYAQLYGKNNMPLYMKLDNPRDYRDYSIGDLMAEKLAFGEDFGTGNGIDGVIGRPSWKGFKGLEEYVSHNPRNIKSSKAVTYDDNGVRIPLGERDNFNINDIRYSWLPWFLGGSTAATLYNKSK